MPRENFNPTWAKSQPRNKKGGFAPKWTKEVMLGVIARLNDVEDEAEIRYDLVRSHEISWASAGVWVKIARRINDFMREGISYDEAVTRDRELRASTRYKRRS